VYKTLWDVRIMIEFFKLKFGNFCMWVVDSLSIPQSGVVCSSPIIDDKAKRAEEL
jgi:hypothetical protein